MNSAAELKRFNAGQAYDQHKEKVVKALSNDPLGLSIAQLMSVCKLSIKTVKDVLNSDEFDNENGVFFLKNKEKFVPELMAKPIEKLTTLPEKVTKETELVADQVEKVTTFTPDTNKAEKITTIPYAQRVRDMFRDNPEGVTLEEALVILGGDRSNFDGQLSSIRKNHFKVELVKLDDGTKKYVPDFSVKEEVGQLANSETEWKDFCESPKDTLSKYKQKINTVITKKSQLSLDAKELAELLKEVLGFENINFWVDHGELTGAYLTSEIQEQN